MAARKTKKVKAHKRKTRSGVITVKAHCRRPPKRAWQRDHSRTTPGGW